MKTPTESRAASAGRKYSSVEELMHGEGIPKPVQEKVNRLSHDSRIATQMAQLRHRSGITQKEMSKRLDVTQSAISKLEAGSDDAITIKEIKEYSRVTGKRISLFFGRPLSDLEAVQMCANVLQNRLESLAEAACQNLETQNDIKSFMSQTFCSLLNIIATCNDKLPVQDDDRIEEVRMEVVTGKVTTPTGTCAVASSPGNSVNI